VYFCSFADAPTAHGGSPAQCRSLDPLLELDYAKIRAFHRSPRSARNGEFHGR
jgi:hypothetical protein